MNVLTPTRGEQEVQKVAETVKETAENLESDTMASLEGPGPGLQVGLVVGGRGYRSIGGFLCCEWNCAHNLPTTGVVVGMCVFQLLRNMVTNPDVRLMLISVAPTQFVPTYVTCKISKENPTAGVLQNYKEGERYVERGLRKYMHNRAPEIMPSINNFFVKKED